jgi:hypothetical protein
LKPRDPPHDMQRGGSQQRLEVRACPPQVPTLTEGKAPGPLREATLDPGPQSVLDVAVYRPWPLACGLDGLVVGLRPDGEVAWSAFRRGARRAGGTRAAGGPVKPEAHHRIAGDVGSGPPVGTGRALGAACLLGLPIHDKGRQIVALAGVRWPARGAEGGAHPIDLRLGLGRHQEVGIDIAAVEHMGAGQQITGG